MIVYFSGSGNSRYVAESLADRLDDQVMDAFAYIRSEATEVFTSEKPWVFVFPIYISTIAKIFADFIQQSAFQGSDIAYFVATCASAIGAAPNDCQKLAMEKQLTYMGTARVQMPQNYIALFQMTPEEECERRYQVALEETEKIARLIAEGEPIEEKPASKFEYQMTKWIEAWYYHSFTSTKKFYATDACVACGLCERKCPTKHITMVDGKPKWSGSCSHCMACINSCPKAAIEYGKGTADKKRHQCKKYQ